jgi:2,6-dihydroxypseudooxynicotine hydrolase
VPRAQPVRLGRWQDAARPHARGVRVRSKCETLDDALNTQTLTLRDVAQRITCPIYVTNARQDRIVPAADAERLAREVGGPKTLNLIEDGNHIANNRPYLWRAQCADWLAAQLR